MTYKPLKVSSHARKAILMCPKQECQCNHLKANWQQAIFIDMSQAKQLPLSKEKIL
jgi:hypothetical protein